jgi:hypothetical protein
MVLRKAKTADANLESLELIEPSRKQKKEDKKREKEIKNQSPAGIAETKSLAIGSLIVLFVLLAVSIISVSVYTKSGKNIEVLGPQGITINVRLSSPIFEDAYTNTSTPDYCNSPKQYQGISGSSLFLTDARSKSLGSVKLGDAVGYNYLGCKFKTFLPLDDSYAGGKVSIFLRFPFGESETFTVDVGDQRPFKIDLKLNLG